VIQEMVNGAEKVLERIEDMFIYYVLTPVVMFLLWLLSGEEE
jgi:hypothetical protein